MSTSKSTSDVMKKIDVTKFQSRRMMKPNRFDSYCLYLLEIKVISVNLPPNP